MTLASDLKPPYCSEHDVPMVWGETEFMHTEDGIEVVVRHIPAWICPYGDDVAFPPGVTDELIATIRALVKVARDARVTHHSIEQQEYLVRAAA
jgi:hypothetical protein